MIELGLLATWMWVGHRAATSGLEPGRRPIAWSLAGMVFGPLWFCVRADQDEALARGSSEHHEGDGAAAGSLVAVGQGRGS